MKSLRILFLLTLAVGLTLTSRAAYLRAKAGLARVLIHRSWHESVRQGKPIRPWPWADTYPVARLRIPRLGYDEIVLENATPRTLAFGPARLLSGAGLGEPGNLELAGHRDTWFKSLEPIAQGDSVEVQWFDARRHQLRQRTYTVEEIRVVLPEDPALLMPTSDDVLTLVTCYPFGRSPYSPQRFQVRATPAGPSQLSQTSASSSPSFAILTWLSSLSSWGGSQWPCVGRFEPGGIRRRRS